MVLRKLLVGFIVIAAVSATLVASAASTTLNVSGQLSNTSPTQSGRIFRDAVPSSCSGKAYPGLFNQGSTFSYEAHGPYGPVTATTCVTIDFDPNSGSNPCGTNAHASAYLNSYDPGNQGANFLGDVGASVTQSFSFEVPAGESFLIVVTTTTSLGPNPGCDYSFTSSSFPVANGGPVKPSVVREPVPGPDMVAIPEGSVVGTFLTAAPLYYLPDLSTATPNIMGVGQSLWVFGQDPTHQFYRVMLSGKTYWVPVDVIGPTYGEPWNGQPLPTTEIASSSVEGAAAD